MSEQNIFDNEIFFEGYKNLRENELNYNDLLEQPAMATLLPDVYDKSVLDLGCGSGNNCKDFANRGARRVVGVDISERMLDLATEKNSDEKIDYINMSMADISKLDEKFDLIYSSLAFHYVEDFEKFSCDMFSLMNDGAYLLFSQEHPIITATFGGEHHHNRDENGNISSFTFSNYGQTGKRSCFWYVDGVEKYHRRFSDIITALCRAGFTIDEVCEPQPSEESAKIRPDIAQKELIKPTFLIVRAVKSAKQNTNLKTAHGKKS